MDPAKDAQTQRRQGYRRNVGIAVFNDAGQVLVAERMDAPGSWQMPQGGIDHGENPWEAALRELKEEIGTNSVKYMGEVDRVLRYDFPQWVHDMYPDNYKGQEQQWFAVRFTGREIEIDLASTEPREFSTWRWGDLKQAAEEVVEFKRDSYREMARQFAKFAVPAGD